MTESHGKNSQPDGNIAARLVYILHQPFEMAVASLRDAFVETELGISADLDIAQRVRSELGVTTCPCWLFSVYSATIFLSALSRSTIAGLVPLHLIVKESSSTVTAEVVQPPSDVIRPIGNQLQILTNTACGALERAGGCRLLYRAN